MADKLIAVKMRADGGKVVKAELTDIGTSGERAFRQLDQGARGGGAGLQNLGFQVQDFAVQVAGGTDASRALAQQLPQLLSGFGLLGVGLGTAAAVFLPLISHFMGATDKAKALKTSLDELGKAGDTYRALLQSALQPMADIRREFGDQAEEVKKLRAAMLGIEEIQYLRSLKAAKAQMTDTFADFDSMMARIDELKAGIFDPTAQIGAQIELETMMGKVQREFGVTYDDAIRIRDAINSWREADGPEAIAEASRNVANVITGIVRESDNVSDSLLNAGESAFKLSEDAGSMAMMLGNAGDNADRIATTDMATPLAAAGSEAWSIAEGLELAARNAAALAAGRIGAGAGRGSDPRQFETDPYWKSQYFPEPYQLQKPKKGGGGRKGGGGSRGVDPAMREAQRLFDSTRTAAEKYDIELAKIAELHEKFPALITDDVQATAIENLREKLKDTKDTTEDLKDGFKDMFKSILDGSSSAGEALSNLLSSFASNLLSSGLDALSGGLNLGKMLGFADGGAFDRGRITAFASGGVVDKPTMFGMRGGLGLMGEAGPEAIMPLTRIGGKLGVAAAGGGTQVIYNIDARGASKGVDELIAAELDRRTPGIVKQSVAATAAARQRGYAV